MSERHFPVALPDISKIAHVFSDQTRAAMCGALMNGQAWTVSELANFCGVARSTASEQVDTLKQAGVVKDIRQGRHRYIALSRPGIAGLIEALAVSTHWTLTTPPSLTAGRANSVFIAGRTCYNHLAGSLGVQLLQQLITCSALDDDFQLTSRGYNVCRAWGLTELQRLGGKPCLDTTHRVYHLGGKLGSAICRQFFVNQWIERYSTHRCVRLTDLGHTALLGFDINLEEVTPPKASPPNHMK